MHRICIHALFSWHVPFIVALCLVGCVAAPLYGQSPGSPSCTDLLDESDSLATKTFTGAWYSNAASIARRLDERYAVLERAQYQCNGNAKASATAQKAYVEAQRRDFTAMTSTFDRFFEQYGQAPTDTSTITATGFRSVHHYYAFLHYHTGDLAEAAQGYVRALEVTPEANITQRINLMQNLALMYQRMHDRDSALRTYRRALQGLDQLNPDDETYRRLRADLLSSRAGLRAELDDSGDMESWHQVETDLRESLALHPDPGTAFQAKRLSALAEARAHLGDSAEALSLSTEALVEARAAESPRTLAFLQHVHGSILMMDGQLDAAEPYLQQSLASQPERRYEDRRRVFQRMGLLHELKGDLAAAASCYQQAIETVEAYRAGLRATEWAAAAFGGWQTGYRGLARVRLAQGRPEDALNVLDRTRARHLADLRMEAKVAHMMSPDRRVHYDSLTQALQTVRSEQARPDSPAHEVRLHRRHTQLMAERQDLLQLPASQSLNVEALQDTLAAQGRIAVSYLIDDGHPQFGRKAQSAAFVITPDTVRVVPLDIDEATLNDDISAASPLLDPDQEGSGIGHTQIDLRVLHDVYNTIVAPVAVHLPRDNTPLTVIPDGPLFRVPLGLLVTEAPASRYAYADARFFIEDRPLSTQLSLSELTRPPSALTERPLDIAALGRSEFGTVTVDSLLANAAGTRSVPGKRGLVDRELPPLPGVERELHRVTGTFGNADMRLNQTATPSALSALLDKASILHLSSHALVNPLAPLQSAFVLSPSPNAPNGDDGLLYLHELQGQFATIPLVNLSGCETAQGIFHKGEGMRSLQYAFRAVGAQATLSALWPIEDDAAVTLNDVFYQHLRDGLPKDEALQRAQIAYLRAHPEQSPFYWAGIVLHGSPQPLTLRAPSPRIPYYMLVLAGCAGLAFIWWSYRNWK